MASDLQDVTYQLLLPIMEAMPNGPITLIHSYQNDGRMVKPYASIRIDTITAPQHERYFAPDEDGYQTVGSWRRATVEVQIYGRNSGAYARRVMLALATNTSLMLQSQFNVAIGNRLMLSAVPELLNASQWEERGIHQFELFYSDEIKDEVGLIEKVEIGYVEGPTEWDNGETDWDNGETIWDYTEYCKSVIEAFPPHTPPHPSPATEKE